jgi:hypothetical protein
MHPKSPAVSPTYTDPASTPPHPPPALHLLDDWWIASCTTCGFTLAEGRRQDRVERKATRRLCPVCHLDAV